MDKNYNYSDNQDNAAAPAAQPSKEGKENKRFERKAPKKSDVDVILTAFRRIYNKQLSRTLTTKKEALNAAYEWKHSSAYPKDSFQRDLAKRIDLLLSSSYFLEDCDKAGIDPFVAASHYVLEGWQTVSDYILRRSGAETSPISDWREAMFDYSEMKSLIPHIATALGRRGEESTPADAEKSVNAE